MARITNDENDALFFDVVLSETFEGSQTVTDHPLEDGTMVSDHSQAKPEIFKVRAYVSQSPFASVLPEPEGLAGEAREAFVLQYLRENKTKPLAYVSARWGFVGRDLLLTQYTVDTPDARRRILVDLTFKTVAFATSEIVEVPPERKKFPKGKVYKGKPSLDPVDEKTIQGESAFEALGKILDFWSDEPDPRVTTLTP